MNATNNQRSKVITRLQQISLTAVLLFSSLLASAQVATIDLTAERNFVYQDGVYSSLGESVLPFVITIHNPSTTTINDIEFSVTIDSGVAVGNVDSQCLVGGESSTPGESSTVLICTLDELKANRSKIIDFYVDGPNSLGVGEGFVVSVFSNDAIILEPDAIEASLADGDRRIRGSGFFIHLVRNIDLDINQNSVPDLDESIMNLPASTPIDELLAREAVIDVLFIYTPAAAEYLGPVLNDRVDQIISIANQTFRENDVSIKFKSVGLEEISYTANDTAILTTFDALIAKTDSAFNELDNLITTSGGDIVVMMQALNTSMETECGYTTLSGGGRQGDFQTLYHRGDLVSAINVGPNCLGRFNMAPMFASNMGVARERQRSPNGGTFSYSAGYGVVDEFRTLGAAIGSASDASSFGSAFTINRFSNPDSLCLGVACGADRNDIANGADAVYSLNKTRHLVSAISPTVFHVEPSAIEDKITVLGNVYDLNVVQTTLESLSLIHI